MESQVTLTERHLIGQGPFYPSKAATVLELSQDNVKNCTIHSLSSSTTLDNQSYTVTSNPTFSRTTIQHAPDQTPLAIIKRSDLGADKITFDGKKYTKISKWLKPSKVLNIFPITFNEDGQTYLWKCDIDGVLSLHLASASGPPIAWFQRPYHDQYEGGGNRPLLVLEPEAVRIQDSVVISFLFLEHKSRMRMKNQGLRIAAMSHGRVS